MTTILRAAFSATTLLAATVAPALAQSPAQQNGQPPRGIFEYFVTSTRLGGESLAEGFGGRMLVPLARDGESFLSRVDVGPFVAWRPESDRSAEVLRFGGQADVRPFTPPQPGRAALEPVLSLAVAAMRGEEPAPSRRLAPETLVPHDVPGLLARQRVGSREASSLAMAPGVGARLRLARGVALRGDLRRIVPLGDGREGTEVSGGLSLPF
jgi:hypothetical protein